MEGRASASFRQWHSSSHQEWRCWTLFTTRPLAPCEGIWLTPSKGFSGTLRERFNCRSAFVDEPTFPRGEHGTRATPPVRLTSEGSNPVEGGTSHAYYD